VKSFCGWWVVGGGWWVVGGGWQEEFGVHHYAWGWRSASGAKFTFFLDFFF